MNRLRVDRAGAAAPAGAGARAARVLTVLAAGLVVGACAGPGAGPGPTGQSAGQSAGRATGEATGQAGSALRGDPGVTPTGGRWDPAAPRRPFLDPDLPASPAVAAPPVPPSAYVGRRWRLTTVEHRGRRYEVPAAVGAWIRFEPGGRLGTDDGVNNAGGRYVATPGGFRPREMGTTLMGYGGNDPVRLAVIDGMGAVAGFDPEVQPGSEVSVGLSSGRLALTVDGFRLTFDA